MKKEIKTTHIDTGGHGYLSVSKKDILLVGMDPTEISGYSGMDFNRVYLEEDSDATLFVKKATEKGIHVDVKQGYNLKFSNHHNYNARLFNLKKEPGQKFKSYNDEVLEIVSTSPKLIAVDPYGKRYKFPTSNPFQYIKDSI